MKWPIWSISGTTLSCWGTWHFGTHFLTNGCLLLIMHNTSELLLSYSYIWMSWTIFLPSPDSLVQPLHDQFGRLRKFISGTHILWCHKSLNLTHFGMLTHSNSCLLLIMHNISELLPSPSYICISWAIFYPHLTAWSNPHSSNVGGCDKSSVRHSFFMVT